MKIGTIVLVTVITAPLAFVSYCTIQDQLFTAGFERIVPGMAEDEVRSHLGIPRNIISRGETTEFGNASECARKYVYDVVATPLNPKYPAICFGDDGRVLRTYTLRSP